MDCSQPPWRWLQEESRLKRKNSVVSNVKKELRKTLKQKGDLQDQGTIVCTVAPVRVFHSERRIMKHEGGSIVFWDLGIMAPPTGQ